MYYKIKKDFEFLIYIYIYLIVCLVGVLKFLFHTCFNSKSKCLTPI